MNRAYSLLEIKEVNDDARIIRGLATTPSPDRAGDIVKPEGAEYTLPLPLLWQHNSGQPIGHVTEARVTKKGIEIVAQIAKGVSEEIDRAWALIKGGLVRGLSIGFRGLDTEQIPNSWGVIFQKWEWLELSAVTIPANAEATIQSVKSIDTEVRAATGIKDEVREETGDPPTGVKPVRVVKLEDPARARAKPFVIKAIKR
jgi:HK97 family phage prohead protease